jgi:hypothetical protein
MIQELWGKVNHRGLVDFLFSHMHAWACAKSIQIKLFKGGYHKVILFYEQNNASKHLHDMLQTISKLELIIWEQELQSIHEQAKHIHIDEYMYKNENK